MADETKPCTKCERELPLEAFAKDARRKSGVRAVCRRCDAAAVADRRRGGAEPKPGGLVLVGKFPEPPVAADPPFEPHPERAPSKGSAATGTYSTAAEAFIDALAPPAGPADALLVRALRTLAARLDDVELGAGDWVVRDTAALVTKLIAVQRELAATRASKGQAAAPEKPNRASVANY